MFIIKAFWDLSKRFGNKSAAAKIYPVLPTAPQYGTKSPDDWDISSELYNYEIDKEGNSYDVPLELHQLK